MGRVNFRGPWAPALALKSSSWGNHRKLALLILIAKLTGLQTSHMLIKKLIKTLSVLKGIWFIEG